MLFAAWARPTHGHHWLGLIQITLWILVHSFGKSLTKQDEFYRKFGAESLPTVSSGSAVGIRASPEFSSHVREEVGAWLKEGFPAANVKKRYTPLQRVLCREVGEPPEDLVNVVTP